MIEPKFLRRLRRWTMSSVIVASAASFLGASAPAVAQSATDLIPAGRCAVIVASRQTVAQARDYIRQSITDQRNVQVFRAANGWFAISIGTLSEAERGPAMARMASEGRIPSDAFCSTGARFLGEVVWREPGVDPQRPAVTATRRPDWMAGAFRAGPGVSCAANGDTSNIRTGPGTTHPIVAALMNGTPLEILRESPFTDRMSWYLVRYTHPSDAGLSVTGHISGMLLARNCAYPHNRQIAGTTGSVIAGREVDTTSFQAARPVVPQPQPQPQPQRPAVVLGPTLPNGVLGVPGVATERAAAQFHGRIGLVRSEFAGQASARVCIGTAVASRVVATDARCVAQAFTVDETDLGFLLGAHRFAERSVFIQRMTVDGRAVSAEWRVRETLVNEQFLDFDPEPGHRLALLLLEPAGPYARLQQTFGTAGTRSGNDPAREALFVAGLPSGSNTNDLDPPMRQFFDLRPVRACRLSGNLRIRSMSLDCGRIDMMQGAPIFAHLPDRTQTQNFVTGVVLGRSAGSGTLQVARLTAAAQQMIERLGEGRTDSLGTGESWLMAAPGDVLTEHP